MALTQISTQGIKDGTITGSDLATNVDLIDNQKLRLGTGNDLQIFHDGSNSHVTSGTGQFFLSSSNSNIWLRGTETGLLNTDGSEYMIRATSNGSVKLFYDNSKKFETTTNGGSLTGDWNVSNDFFWFDNGEAVFGSGGDLKIYHNGSNSYIDNHTGDLNIRGNGDDIFLKPVDTEVALKAIPNGAVELYHDNSKKFETNADGVVVNGVTVSTGNIQINNDTAKIRLGASQDLEIYHDGTDSRIVNTTGDLSIRGNSIKLTSTTGEEYLRCTANGSTELFHDNVVKLTTNSDGYRSNDNVKAQFGVGSDLEIFHNGSHSKIVNSTGQLQLLSDSFRVNNAASSEAMISANANGAVELYYDNSKKFETTSAGVTVSGDLTFSDSAANDINLRGGKIYGDDSALPAFTIQNTSGNSNHAKIVIGDNFGSDNGGITFYGAGSSTTDVKLRIRGTTDTVEISDNHKFVCGDGSDLQLYHDGSHTYANNSTGFFHIRSGSAIRLQKSDGEPMIYAIPDGAVELYYDQSKKLETTGNGVAIGGSTSVDQHLHVENSGGDAMLRLRGNTNYGVLFTKHSDGSLTGYVGSGGAVNLGASNIGICASLAGGMIKFQTGGTSASNERVAINSSGMMTFDGGGSSYPWGGSFREDGSGSDNSVRLFFEGDNGVSNRTFSIMSENGKLRVSGGGTAGSATGTQLVYLASTSSTSWTSGSDIRLKENITEIPSVLDKIKNYRCARFNFIGDDASDIQNIKFGFIAQDWLTDFPEVISKSTQDADDPTDTTEYYGMQYTETIPVLLKAIQELVSKVEVLETEVAVLKAA